MEMKSGVLRSSASDSVPLRSLAPPASGTQHPARLFRLLFRLSPHPQPSPFPPPLLFLLHRFEYDSTIFQIDSVCACVCARVCVSECVCV